MARILAKEQWSEHVFMFKVFAPAIAERRKAGNFIILRLDKQGERVPLTIADADTAQGSITLVVQAVGKSTIQLSQMNVGDEILDIMGPLGKPTEVHKVGTVVCVGGGIGIAPLHPIAQAMHAAGNKVISILGARDKSLIIMEDYMRKASDEIIICTDNGSYGTKGLVTDMITMLINRGEKISEVVAIGPAIMMKFVAKLTKQHEIKTVVSLNPIMIDGTGMCGGCRVVINGKTQFVCVDGPEFDGHQVDFDGMMRRQGMFKEYEKRSLEAHRCKIAG
ncbi:MAG: sulfide/dihydroorotate dehydrogenase-like FAD/NAD-binding protein [Spirochaetes bacterium]|nr:sulfide/dihydroorotate dehydrogenase-like FAD/NAD-binding protein [Spirochaetota bacterium]